MAEKRAKEANRNLLFSPSELNFSVPFIPVSRPGPFSSSGEYIAAHTPVSGTRVQTLPGTVWRDAGLERLMGLQ